MMPTFQLSTWLKYKIHAYLIYPFAAAIRNRGLLLEMTSRELFSSRLGHGFALFWTLAQPAIAIAVYLTVFTTIFRSELIVDGVQRNDIHLYIVSGELPWLFMAEVMSRSCSLMRGKGTFIRHFAKPIVLIPLASLGGLILPFLIQIMLLIVFCIIKSSLQMSIALLPVVLMLHFFMMVGLTLLLSSISALSTTFSEFVRIFISIGMYISPILYLGAGKHRILNFIIVINPFTHIIRLYQDVFFFGKIASPFSAGVAVAICISTFALGVVVFRQASPRFSSVL